ncbi:MAG TPA: glycosyltransferase family 4 protein [Terriglobales bacterium]|nr:glycosyltransferase family 4 protein [Terriglobales bacterium]
MIIGLFTELANVGGVQLAGRQTAAALVRIGRERGWPCFFLTLNDSPGEHELCAADTMFSFRGFGRRKLRFVIQAMRLATRQPQLIFVAHPNLAPTAIVMKAIARNARTIVGSHGIEVWQPLPLIRRTSFRRADLILAPSAYTLEKGAQAQCVTSSKMRKIPWPLDIEFLTLSEFPANLLAAMSFPRGPIVLSVGRWSSAERYKGADLLIRSMVQLSDSFPDLQLILAGPGDDIARLRNEAQHSRVSERVHFFPLTSRKELAALYSRADIFALPSTGEGFGLVFLEAMAFGKPIIGTNAGGIPDVVQHEREGLLVSPTVEAISSALRRLLSDPVLRKEMGMLGRERVRTEFSFSRFQEQLNNAVDLVLAHKQQGTEAVTT